MSEDTALRQAFISALEQQAKQGELSMPSPETQRELVPLASSSLVPQTPSRQFSSQEYEPALRALLEYVQGLEEAASEGVGKSWRQFPFEDTGIYLVSESDPSQALYNLATLLNEALRKKTLARIGRKLLLLNPIADIVRTISCCFGWYNIGIALPQMLYKRPSGFLEPLSNTEWQELAEKAVTDMLERRQLLNVQGVRYDESETNFGTHPKQSYFWSDRRYPFAYDEAKQAAERIVTIEALRLKLFLGALQGTLRFLDRLTGLADYRETRLTLQTAFGSLEAAKQHASQLINLLETLLKEPDRERKIQAVHETAWESTKIEDESTQVQGELVPAPLALLQQQSFDEVIASPFVDLYLKRLVAATQEKVTQKDGEIILPRWKIEGLQSSDITSIYYGYHPSEVASALKQLLGLLTKATQGNSRMLLLSRDMLFGFSGVLGYYNLCRYLLQSPTDMEKKDVVWLQRLLNLSISNTELESTMSDTNATSWLEHHLPHLAQNEGLGAGLPCYCIQYGSWSTIAGTRVANLIINAERRRLLDFRQSLYLFLTVLAPPEQRGLEGIGGDAMVAVKEVTEENGTHYYSIQLSDNTHFSGSRSFIVAVPEDGEIALSEDDTDG